MSPLPIKPIFYRFETTGEIWAFSPDTNCRRARDYVLNRRGLVDEDELGQVTWVYDSQACNVVRPYTSAVISLDSALSQIIAEGFKLPALVAVQT